MSIIGFITSLFFISVLFGVTQPVFAACDGNRDCPGDRPFCVQKSCVECRNPGSSNDCKNGKVCSSSHHCVVPTQAPQPPQQPPQQPPAPSGGTSCQSGTSDIMLVIDSSNSMAGGKLAQAKAAANRFIDIVAKNPQNRVGIAHFDNNGGLRQGLTTQYSAAKQAVSQLSTPGNGDGGTCLECAIDKKGDGDVLSAFRNAGGNNKRAVIILTDGRINRWMTDNGEIKGSTGAGDEATARDQALRAINTVRSTYGAVFSVIQYGGESNKGWLVGQVINAPGSYQSEASGETLEKMYADLGNEIIGGSITAFTYFDANKNGTFDTGDIPLENVDAKLGTTVKKTDASGKALFDKLCPGSFNLTISQPSDYQLPPGGTLTKTVPLGPGGNVQENFPFIKETGVTITVTPPPDPVDGPMTFMFKLALHGLGIAGDNVLPRPDACKRGTTGSTACLSNQNPKHPIRDLSVELINNLNEVVATMSGKLTYSSSSGLFEAKTSITPGIEKGAYTFSVKTPMYLVKKILFRKTLEPDNTYELPETDMTSSDVDNDNSLTVLDYNQIVKCYTFVNQPSPCNEEEITKVDNDDNGVIDEFTINLFLRDISVINGD